MQWTKNIDRKVTRSLCKGWVQPIANSNPKGVVVVLVVSSGAKYDTGSPLTLNPISYASQLFISDILETEKGFITRAVGFA